jgi:NTP pyrophosphatase (non-canonical NTP hydrolase)
MTKQETRAVAIANEYVGEKSSIKRMHKLGEEVLELAMAIQSGDKRHIDEELGDVLYILLHVASRNNPKKSLADYAQDAAVKMIERRTVMNPAKRKKQLKFLMGK